MMNLPKPVDQEKQALKQMSTNGHLRALNSYLERVLTDIRIHNDDLPRDEIQIGQGMAKSVKSLITIFKEYT